jgi:dihydrofolate reductase
MVNTPFKITAHMVSSVDGYIAKKDNSIGWFETTSHYENGADEPDVAAFLKTIDCYVMGSHTYELALSLSKNYGWPYGDIPTVVVTQRNLPVERKNVELHSGDLNQLVVERLKPLYRNVWVVGGAALVKALIRLNLVDEIRQTIIPVLLGDGIHFYDHIGIEKPLHLINVTAYKNGLVELCYGTRERNT